MTLRAALHDLRPVRLAPPTPTTMPAFPVRFHRRRTALTAALILVSAAAASCGEAAPGSIDRETFVEVWVDLRAAVVAAPGGVISTAERDRILEAHGVTEEDLVGFAEVHGADISFMVEVWAEVDERMSGAPAEGGAES